MMLGAAMLAFWLKRALLVLAVVLLAPMTAAQEPGGLYIAGDQFTFEQAARRALNENVQGERFFVVVLPPAAQPLDRESSGESVALRNRILVARGVLIVCQRDVASGAVDASGLVPGVVALKGWPPPDFDTWPPDQLYYPGENPSRLPVPTEQLRRARAVCS
jgi:hypothetical protein